MKYFFALFLGVFSFLWLSAQEVPVDMGGSDAMRLVSSTRGVFLKQNIMRHYNPVYEHKGNTLMADSGEFWKDELGREYFKANGHVVITQPSGTVIYADNLHYEAAIQHAILTNNVRVVDDQSVLTTNYLTYNFRDQRGTYTGGGRIENQRDTITSQNAYYFERTKDTYFRKNVVVRSPDVIIYTDTMRYNSGTRDNFFFGPTNIKGTAGENLYTERGVYNTGSGIAKFNQNNLFTQESKILKGDSLYYERSTGDGEAFRNVVFIDTLEKFYATGDYGKYRQHNESITMADKPLIKMVVDNDTSKANVDTVQTAEIDVDSLSRRERRELRRSQRQAERNEANIDQDSLVLNIDIDTLQTDSLQRLTADETRVAPSPVDTVYMTADTIFSQMILASEYQALELNLDREGGAMMEEEEIDYGEFSDDVGMVTDSITDSLQTELPLGNDSIAKPIISESVNTSQDSLAKIARRESLSSEDSLRLSNELEADSVLRANVEMPRADEVSDIIGAAMESVLTVDSTAHPTDSIRTISDTTRTRIIKAYHNVRLFKSDLQAVSDSVYYGMQDSMFRFMGNPMIWADGSQISADTIYMQMVNQKLDNALLKNNAFMVNAVLDSVKFNQLKGRRFTIFFAQNNIERLFVDGNAENLVFNVDEQYKVIKDMFHDRGARLKILFRDKQVHEYFTYKANQQVYPLKMVTQENEILPGFIWRPQDRPSSVEDMINRKRTISTNVGVGAGETEGDEREASSPQGQAATTGSSLIDPKQEIPKVEKDAALLDSISKESVDQLEVLKKAEIKEILQEENLPKK